MSKFNELNIDVSIFHNGLIQFFPIPIEIKSCNLQKTWFHKNKKIRLSFCLVLFQNYSDLMVIIYLKAK